MERAYEIEVMRLLCQLAAADGEVARVEQDLIFSRAKDVGIDVATIELQRSALAAGEIPEPDLDILRRHIDETRGLARRLIAADGVLADAELTALHALEKALLEK